MVISQATLTSLSGSVEGEENTRRKGEECMRRKDEANELAEPIGEESEDDLLT